MSAIGQLWTPSNQIRSHYILAVAALTGQKIDLPAYEHYQDNKSSEFLAKFPHGKIPAFERADGFRLFEGVVIAKHVASLAPNSGLLGRSKEDEALIDQWIHLADSEIFTHTLLTKHLVAGRLGNAYSKPVHTAFSEREDRAFDTFNSYLASRTFLVGERITLADVYLATAISYALPTTFDAAHREKYPHVLRHFETIYNQAGVREVFGEVVYTEKAAQYTPPAKEKKEPKPAAPAAPKAEKKPKAKEEDEEEEPAVPAEPKVKNPLDDLPKSTFNLEDWKRAYSNLDTRGAGGSLEWFYKNFDAEGFSVYRVDFKYNEELTLTFMSSNQIGGFFNRLEGSRKYLFGSVGVLGQSNASIISGVLILRGQDVKPVVDVAPDWESYEYKKLDLSSESDKAFFEAALAWDLEIDGKKWVDGKNFK